MQHVKPHPAEGGKPTANPIVVTGCGDCPFNTRGQWPFCDHEDARERDGGNDIQVGARELDGAMSWCPLRRSPALVVLRERQS